VALGAGARVSGAKIDGVLLCEGVLSTLGAVCAMRAGARTKLRTQMTRICSLLNGDSGTKIKVLQSLFKVLKLFI
jgi:hypothetical protein